MPRVLPSLLLAAAVALSSVMSVPRPAWATDTQGPPIYQTRPGVFTRLPTDGGPSLAPGNPSESGNQGDCANAYAPTVLYQPNSTFPRMGPGGGPAPYNFLMYYTGECPDTGNTNSNMNMAISGDGIVWGKYVIGGDCAGCENPVMDPRAGRFDSRVIAPSVIDDRASDCRCYRVLYEGRRNNVSQIGLATTTTLVDFQPTDRDPGAIRPDDPVIRRGLFPYMAAEVGDPTWLKDGNVYKVWFTAVDSEGRTSIGYGESLDGGLTWNIRNRPVLERGGPGAPDSNFVGEPMVIKDRNGIFRMWYRGDDSANTSRILYATSTDGVNWTKYGFNGGVVMTLPNDAVLDGNAYDPAVVEDEFGNWWMWFVGRQRPNNFLIFMAFNPRPVLNEVTPGSTTVSGQGTPQTPVTVSYVDTGQVIASGTVDANGNFSFTVPPIQAGRALVARVDGRTSNVVGQQGPPPASRQIEAVSVIIRCSTCPTPPPSGQGTWRQVFSGSTLRGISMLSSNEGFAVGNGGTALRGGINGWLLTAAGTSETLHSVFAVAPNLALAVGSNGTAKRWNGSAWSDAPLPAPLPGVDLFGVSLHSATRGWMVDSLGRAYPWNGTGFLGASTLSAVGSPIRGVHSLADTVALAVSGNADATVDPGDNSIFQWTGIVWQPVATALVPLNGVAGVLSGATLGQAYAVGDAGVIMRFNGASWSQIPSPTGNRLNAVALLSATEGWAVGDNLTILRLSGGTWTLYTGIGSVSPPNANLRSVWILNANEAWAAGDGVILRYTVP
ncbi:MAG: Ig-like domain-containing protein [Dehalococcoidia bacterium]|nr:Ig-like domain-containing protein [Dehalococcoidia bacterium]